jgi:hypothetical protein
VGDDSSGVVYCWFGGVYNLSGMVCKGFGPTFFFLIKMICSSPTYLRKKRLGNALFFESVGELRIIYMKKKNV